MKTEKEKRELADTLNQTLCQAQAMLAELRFSCSGGGSNYDDKIASVRDALHIAEFDSRALITPFAITNI